MDGETELDPASGIGEALQLLFDPMTREDPATGYRSLRALGPVVAMPWGGAVVSSHAGANRVLRHPRLSADSRHSTAQTAFRAAASAEGRAYLELQERVRPFLLRDPPDHTRLRRLAGAAFTPSVVAGLGPFVAAEAARLVAMIDPDAPFDAVKALAYPLPVAVIAQLLGVPRDDEPRFAGFARVLLGALEPSFRLEPEEAARRADATNGFIAYFSEHIADRRRAPRDDLLSKLIAARDGEDLLTEDEVVSTCLLLLVAGYVTTTHLIGALSVALARRPELAAAWTPERPVPARAVVEEVLRLEPPVRLTSRTAREDLVLDGLELAAGSDVLVLLGAANRDPEVFVEPDELKLDRSPNPHLAFGAGIHFCLGAPLARLEADAAIGALLERFGSLSLVERPQRVESLVFGGYRSVILAGSVVSR